MNMGKEVEISDPLPTGSGMENDTDTLGNSPTVTQIVKPYDPEIPLLSTYLREMKTYVNTKPCMSTH